MVTTPAIVDNSMKEEENMFFSPFPLLSVSRRIWCVQELAQNVGAFICQVLDN